MAINTKQLTDIEKLAIEKLIDTGSTIDVITKKLNRSSFSKAVQNHIDAYQKNNNEVFDTDNTNTPKEIYDQAINRIVKGGLPAHMADSMVQKAISRFKKEGKKIETAEQLKDDALAHISAGDLIAFTSDSGDRGVAIMTEAATQRADDSRKMTRQSSGEHIFKPKGE